MLDVLWWVGDGFRAVVGTMVMLTPGIAFWLVVVGIIAIIQRGRYTGLYQIVWDKIQYNLRIVAQKVTPKVSTK